MSNNRKESSVDRSTMTATRSSNDAQPTEQTEHSSMQDQIRMRAYELYLARGNEPSDALADWLRAEREYFEPSDDRVQSAGAARPSQQVA